jgi:hypothetical protein
MDISELDIDTQGIIRNICNQNGKTEAETISLMVTMALVVIIGSTDLRKAKLAENHMKRFFQENPEYVKIGRSFSDIWEL